MPIPSPRKGEEQDSFMGRCHSALKGEFPDQKQRTAVCFDSWRKKGGKPKKEKVKLRWTESFEIEEEKEENENSVKITGPLLREVGSRNGRSYKLDEIKRAKFTSDTMSVNHTESVTDNVGIFKPIPTREGFNFEATIQNTPYHPGIVQMIRNGLVKFTSIEAIADEIVKEDEEMVVKGLDITGLGMVKTPGIPEMTIAIAEHFPEEEAGETMEEKKLEEIKEEEKEEEKPKEEPEEKEEPKESLIEKEFKKLEKDVKERETNIQDEIRALQEEVTKIKEKTKTKGIVTEENAPKYNLTKKPNPKGGVDLFSEEFVY